MKKIQKRETAWKGIDFDRINLIKIALLAISAFVYALRAPWLIVSPCVYAEDGTIYLSYAWTHSFWETLFASHQGYYHFVCNLFGLIAARAPLEYAGYIALGFCLAIQLLPALIVVFGGIPFLKTDLAKAVALFTILLVPAGEELYLNVCNTHFILCLVTGLILVSSADGKKIIKWALLVIGGLTVPSSVFLTPLFYFQWWQERNRNRLVQCAILTVCALAQMVAMLQPLKETSYERHFGATIPLVIAVAYSKVILSPVVTSKAILNLEPLRNSVANGHIPPYVVLVTAVLLGLFLFMCLKSGKTATLLAAASLWLFLLSFAGWTKKADHSQLIIFGARYHYAIQCFFFLAMLAAIVESRRYRIIGGLWLTIFLGVSAWNYATTAMVFPNMVFGPPWEAEVKQWQQDQTKPLRLRPSGWSVELKPNK